MIYTKGAQMKTWEAAIRHATTATGISETEFEGCSAIVHESHGGVADDQVDWLRDGGTRQAAMQASFGSTCSLLFAGFRLGFTVASGARK